LLGTARESGPTGGKKMSASKMSASKAPWYVPTPARVLVALLIAQAILFFSQHYQWFEFNRPKGNTLLIACAVTLLGLLAGMAWMLVRLFGSRAQFNLATLFLIVPVIAVPCAWFARDYQQAEEQRLLVKSLKLEPVDWLGYNEKPALDEPAPWSLRTRARRLLEPKVGIDFFADVVELEMVRNINQREIAQVVSFPRLERLSLAGQGIAQVGLAWLKDLAHLKDLRLDDHQFYDKPGLTRYSDADMQVVGGLGQLEKLYLSASIVSDNGLQHLSRLSKLKQLDFSPRETTDEGLRHLENLRELTTLNLSESKVTDTGLASLRRLPHLERVRLRLTHITDRGLAPLAELTALTMLDLSRTEITDAGLEQLRGLRHLSHLNLDGTRVAKLATIGSFGELQVLDLINTQVTDGELSHLRELTQLKVLRLNRTEVTDAGLVHLSGLKNLTELELSRTKVGNAGMKHLAGLPRLEELRLEATQVGDKGLEDLQNLPRLIRLMVINAQVTTQGEAKFKKALPRCSVYQGFSP
jgi:internalin A